MPEESTFTKVSLFTSIKNKSSVLLPSPFNDNWWLISTFLVDLTLLVSINQSPSSSTWVILVEDPPPVPLTVPGDVLNILDLVLGALISESSITVVAWFKTICALLKYLVF